MKSMLIMPVSVWLAMSNGMDNALHALNMLMKRMDNATVILTTYGMKLISNAILLNQLAPHDPNGTRKS